MTLQDKYALTHHVIDGKWCVERRLGAGGMGEVYEIRHHDYGTRFALKVLNLAYANQPSVVERFHAEARTASRIRHDAVVQIIDGGTLPDDPPFFGRPYFTMEFVEGEDLDKFLARKGLLEWRHAHKILVQIAAGLEVVHTNGVLHRDIKPSNCLLLPDPEGRGDIKVKIIDFGIAKTLTPEANSRSPLTSPGFAPGTSTYMAPELFVDPINASGRSDIFSFGVLTYRLLVGREPFPGPSTAQLFEQHQRLDLVQSPLSTRPDLPPAVGALTMEMLAFDPKDRPPNMREVHQRLRRLNARHTPTILRFGASSPVGLSSGEGRDLTTIEQRRHRRRTALLGSDRTGPPSPGDTPHTKPEPTVPLPSPREPTAPLPPEPTAPLPPEPTAPLLPEPTDLVPPESTAPLPPPVLEINTPSPPEPTVPEPPAFEGPSTAPPEPLTRPSRPSTLVVSPSQPAWTERKAVRKTPKVIVAALPALANDATPTPQETASPQGSSHTTKNPSPRAPIRLLAAGVLLLGAVGAGIWLVRIGLTRDLAEEEHTTSDNNANANESRPKPDDVISSTTREMGPANQDEATASVEEDSSGSITGPTTSGAPVSPDEVGSTGGLAKEPKKQRLPKPQSLSQPPQADPPFDANTVLADAEKALRAGGRAGREQALALLDQVLTHDPKSSRAHRHRSDALFDLGRFKEAAESAAAAVENSAGENQDRNRLWLGKVLIKLGKTSEGCNEFARVTTSTTNEKLKEIAYSTMQSKCAS